MPVSACISVRPYFSEVLFVYKNMTCGSLASESSCVYEHKCDFIFLSTTCETFFIYTLFILFVCSAFSCV